MNREQKLTDVMTQFNEGAITATEMLNKIFEILGPNETQEFWEQFEESEAIESNQDQTERAMRGELTIE